MGQSDSLMRFPSCGSVSARQKRVNWEHVLGYSCDSEIVGQAKPRSMCDVMGNRLYIYQLGPNELIAAL